ncbi:site-specific integrase [Butyricicoccus faecihominis]|uniref:site-specific integrase n=1 Tax=Butyricicoccus faecihominis TaxID=1712515 RepID=UPI00247849E1|nr:site-specific integrase [Butyricicoccus faecihominis]MCQ5129578.1 site-specific integrase [Butyricicoccus faecihominis]
MASKKQLNKSLQHRLSELARFGQSKHKAKQLAKADYLARHGNLKGWNPAKVEGIFSIKTMETYRAAIETAANWFHSHGYKSVASITPEVCKSYLKDRESKGLSAWTISRDMAALNKCFNYSLCKSDIGLRERLQSEVIRSREVTESDNRDFTKFSDAITIALSCGCRRQSVKQLRPADFLRNTQGMVYAVQLHEKGGKDRIAPILNNYKKKVTEIVNRLQHDNNILFTKYDSHIDNHDFRAVYAASLLHQLEEERAEGLPLCGGDFDVLRKNCNLRGRDISDKKYRGHDRDIMGAVSGSLGHNRLDVVMACYSRYI